MLDKILPESLRFRDGLLQGHASLRVSGLDHRIPGFGENRKCWLERFSLIENSAVVLGAVAVIVNDQAVIPIVRDVNAEFSALQFAEFRLGMSGREQQ